MTRITKLQRSYRRVYAKQRETTPKTKDESKSTSTTMKVLQNIWLPLRYHLRRMCGTTKPMQKYLPAMRGCEKRRQCHQSMKTEQRKHSDCTTELRKKHSIQACVSKQPAHNATLTSLVWVRCNHIRCPLMSLLRAACRSFQM